ncbi:MAG: MATE family efflux transporter [Acidimicrobiales bacterium]
MRGGVPRRSPYDRDIYRLALPALGALIAEPLYRLTDAAVVGHLGTDELAGMAVANAVLATGFAVFIFLAYGTTSAVARLIGAGEHGRAAHQAVQSLWLAVLLGVVLSAFLWIVAGPLVELLGGEGAVAANARVYLRISVLGLPITFVILAGVGYLRGLQDTRTPLLVAVGTALVNLVLEVWWIFGLDYGIGASALSTLVAEALAATIYLTMIRRATREHRTTWRPDRRAIAGLGRAGVALFLRTAALRGAFTLATAVAARIGTAELAAYQIAFELMFLLALTLDAIAIAGQALTGRFLGAGDGATARAAGQRMIEWSVVAGVILGVGLAVLSPVLPDLFSNDAEVVALAAFQLLWVAALQPLNGLVFALDGILIGAGDLAFLAKAMIVAFLVFAPAAIAVLVLDLGIGWVWAALALLFLARAVVLGARFRGEAWIRLGAE